MMDAHQQAWRKAAAQHMHREATGAKIDRNLRLYKYSETPLGNTARRSEPFAAFFQKPSDYKLFIY